MNCKMKFSLTLLAALLLIAFARAAELEQAPQEQIEACVAKLEEKYQSNLVVTKTIDRLVRLVDPADNLYTNALDGHLNEGDLLISYAQIAWELGLKGPTAIHAVMPLRRECKVAVRKIQETIANAEECSMEHKDGNRAALLKAFAKKPAAMRALRVSAVCLEFMKIEERVCESRIM